MIGSRRHAALVALAVLATVVLELQGPVEAQTSAPPKFTAEVKRKETPGRAVDIDVDISRAKELYLVVASGGGGWGDWIQPRLVGPKGEMKLTELAWKYATVGYNRAQVNANAGGRPMRVEGRKVAYGIGVYAPSVVVYDLPPGYSRLKARGGLDDDGWGDATFMVFTANPLLDPGSGPLWTRDPDAPAPVAPDAFVEMVGGDRLPGNVIGYRPREPEPCEAVGPHFLVAPPAGVGDPNKPPVDHVRVLAPLVRRIVWQRRKPADAHEPGTARLRDGRVVRFRAARFHEGGVELLTEERIVTPAFSEMAEIDLPRRDPWQAYCDELATICPGGKSQLVQLETTTGMTVTGAPDRMQVRWLRVPGKRGRWWVVVQPAWCVESLWIDQDVLSARRLFWPHQLPLDRLRPDKVESRGMLSRGAWRWRAKRNAQGGLLRSGGRIWPWGLGVHAFCQLEFPLPDYAASFRTRVGLDQAAGSGGCVRARVWAGSTDGKPLYESPPIIGSDRVLDTGSIRLAGSPKSPERLILQIDPVLDGRPSGADPLDIRDVCDWIAPQLDLDPGKLQAEVRRRVIPQLAAWQGWTVSPDDPGAIAWGACYDEGNGNGPGRFRTTVSTQTEPLTLSRQLDVGDRDHWLLISAGRDRDAEPPPKITVRIDGEPAAEYEVPRTHQGQPQPPPLPVSLADYKGRRIQVQLVQSPTGSDCPVYWRAVRVSDQLPALHRLLEDDDRFVAVDRGKKATCTPVEDDVYVGRRAVKITRGGRFRLPIKPAIPIREHPTGDQYRYFRFAIRKFGRGRVNVELEHADAKQRPARYDAGTVDGNAVHVWRIELPGEWIVTDRDVYADFGSLDLTGLVVSVPDGEYALVDHIYLARSPNDFKILRWAPPPEETNRHARRVLAHDVLEKGNPAVVSFEVEGRRGTGVLVGKEGVVLTAGHVLAGRGKDATVRLADGRRVKGKTAGILRDFDLGAIRITEKIDAPGLEISTHEELEPHRLYVGFSFTPENYDAGSPSSFVADIAAEGEKTFRIDYNPGNVCFGGPFLDRDGKIAGIHTGRGPTGVLQISKAFVARSNWSRLKRGDIWGRWLAGSGPLFGADVAPAHDGCRVTRTYGDSPAAKADVKTGDVLEKIDGKPVTTPEEVAAMLAEKNPGDEMSLDIRRGKETLHKKLRLAPRLDEAN